MNRHDETKVWIWQRAVAWQIEAARLNRMMQSCRDQGDLNHASELMDLSRIAARNARINLDDLLGAR